jgi:hypothetical protein
MRDSGECSTAVETCWRQANGGLWTKNSEVHRVSATENDRVFFSLFFSSAKEGRTPPQEKGLHADPRLSMPSGSRCRAAGRPDAFGGSWFVFVCSRVCGLDFGVDVFQVVIALSWVVVPRCVNDSGVVHALECMSMSMSVSMQQ